MAEAARGAHAAGGGGDERSAPTAPNPPSTSVKKEAKSSADGSLHSGAINESSAHAPKTTLETASEWSAELTALLTWFVSQEGRGVTFEEIFSWITPMWAGIRDGSGGLMTRTSDTSHVVALRRHLQQAGAVRQHSRYTLPPSAARPSEAEAQATMAEVRLRAAEVAARAPPPAPAPTRAEVPAPNVKSKSDVDAFRAVALERLGTQRMTSMELAIEVKPRLGALVNWRGVPYSRLAMPLLAQAIGKLLHYVPHVRRDVYKRYYVSAAESSAAPAAPRQPPAVQPEALFAPPVVVLSDDDESDNEDSDNEAEQQPHQATATKQKEGMRQSKSRKSTELILLLRKCLSEHPGGATLEQICRWLDPLVHGIKLGDGLLYNRDAFHLVVKRLLPCIGATQSRGRYRLSHSADAPSLGATLGTVKAIDDCFDLRTFRAMVKKELGTGSRTAAELGDALRPKLGDLRSFNGALYRGMSNRSLRQAVGLALCRCAERGDDGCWRVINTTAAANCPPPPPEVIELSDDDVVAPAEPRADLVIGPSPAPSAAARPTSPLAAFESFSDRGDATDGSKRAAPLTVMPEPKRARSDVAAQCLRLCVADEAEVQSSLALKHYRTVLVPERTLQSLYDAIGRRFDVRASDIAHVSSQVDELHALIKVEEDWQVEEMAQYARVAFARK